MIWDMNGIFMGYNDEPDGKMSYPKMIYFMNIVTVSFKSIPRICKDKKTINAMSNVFILDDNGMFNGYTLW